MNSGPGPLALVGSGEYLAVMAGVEGALIEGRPRRYVQIPTAAAPEGPDRLQYWPPDLAARAAAGAPPGTTVIGIDEDTAIVDLTGGGRNWHVHGRQQAWVLTSGQDHGAGQDHDTGQDHGTGQPFPAGAN